MPDLNDKGQKSRAEIENGKGKKTNISYSKFLKCIVHQVSRHLAGMRLIEPPSIIWVRGS